MKCPNERAASHGVAKINARMTLQVARGFGTGATRQVGRRGHGHKAAIGEFASDQGRRFRLTEMDSHIDTVGDQVADMFRVISSSARSG